MEILDSNMVLWLSTICLRVSHCLGVHPKCTWSRNDVGSTKSTCLVKTFHIGIMFSFLPANLTSSTYTEKNNSFGRYTEKHSQLGTFSQPCSIRIFSTRLSHNSRVKRWPYKFRSRRTAGSSMLDISIMESSVISEHLPSLHGRYCVRCLSCATG